jgi:hypothetical protein
MRRWLPILLFVLLPFQLSWASVGVYAQHESGLVGQHVDHHTHDLVVHSLADEALRVAINTASNTAQFSKFTLDSSYALDMTSGAHTSIAIDDHFFDCDSTCIFMLNEATWVSLLVIATPMVAKRLVNPASLLSLQPDRPNWLALA